MTPKFPFATIAQEYLTHADPESVYEWLISNAGEATSTYDSPFSTELLAALLARNDTIINLGLAAVATENSILEQLWATNNPAIRTAIASNVYRDRGFAGIWPHKWVSDEELISALEDGPPEFVRAWCTNPVLAREGLADALSKEGIYQKLSESKFKAVIYWALQNPNLQNVRESDRFALDGWDWYQESLPFAAAWSLLLTLPNTREYAYLVCERFGKIAEFSAPYDTLLKEKEADPIEEKEKWEQQYRESERLFLERVLHRWSADASEDPKARDEEGKEAFEFQILRENIAAAVPDFESELQEFIKGHADVYVRRGHYRSFRPSSTEIIEKYYEKDGKDFLEAAVYNNALYDNSIKGVRAQFRELINGSNDMVEFEDHQMLRSTWHYRATDLFGKYPARFPDPDASDYEGEDQDNDRRSDESWSQRLEEMESRIGQLLTKISMPQNGAAPLENEQRRAASEMVLLVGKITVEISRKVNEINESLKRSIENFKSEVQLKLKWLTILILVVLVAIFFSK